MLVPYNYAKVIDKAADLLSPYKNIANALRHLLLGNIWDAMKDIFLIPLNTHGTLLDWTLEALLGEEYTKDSIESAPEYEFPDYDIFDPTFQW